MNRDDFVKNPTRTGREHGISRRELEELRGEFADEWADIVAALKGTGGSKRARAAINAASEVIGYVASNIDAKPVREILDAARSARHRMAGIEEMSMANVLAGIGMVAAAEIKKHMAEATPPREGPRMRRAVR